MTFHRLSELDVEICAAIERLLLPDPVLSFYWDTGIADLALGINNRLIRLCGNGQGVILGVVFGELTVFSPYGLLDDDDISACADWPGMVEIHAPLTETPRYRGLIRDRLIQAREMLIFGLDPPVADGTMPAHRVLTPDDQDIVASFYRAYYPETAFDPYMLDMPFIGVFDEGTLVAGAGTLVQSARQQTALIGHFLTAPQARGRGLATALGRALLRLLEQAGYRHVYLATTVDNPAAIRVYERLGFSVADRRTQLDLRP